MSLMTIIQQVCGRTNIPVPSSVMGGTSDTQVLQLLRLLEEEGQELASRYPWEGITNEFTLTTIAAEDQGAMATIAPNGFRALKTGTFFDRTDSLPILGPLTDQEWQHRKAIAMTGPRYDFRLRGGHLLVNPIPAAGHTWAGEYWSKNWILGIDGTTYKQYFTLDTDTLLIPEELCLSGLRWRWKKEKGFDYAEDFRSYEMQVKDAMSQDGGKRSLHMDKDMNRPKPGIGVPEYSWSLP